MQSHPHLENSFVSGSLLKNHGKNHESKPTQFVSVAGGVQKRLENSLSCRRSRRLTQFDSIRNLPKCSSPVPLSEAQQKMEHRRQQLKKWKEDKAKKKKEVASQKKKPFITGVTHTPLHFISLPLAPVRPSTSGRVTRSQTAWRSKEVKEKQTLSQSFAPKNATFEPPQFKKVPYVNLVSPIKSKTSTYTFDPVLPQNNTQKHTVNAVKWRKLLPAPQALVFQSIIEADSSSQSPIYPVKTRKSGPPNSTILVSKAPIKSTPRNVLEVKQFTPKTPVSKHEYSSRLPQNNTQKHTVNAVKLTKSRAQNKPVEAKVTRKPSEVKTKSKTTKPLPENSKTFQSSSSSDDSQFPVLRTRKLLPAPQSLVFQSITQTDSSSQAPIFPVRARKSRPPDSTILVSKAPRHLTPRNVLEVKQFTPKNPVSKSESSSRLRLRSPRSPPDTQMTPEQIKEEAKNISSCVIMVRGKNNARKEHKKKLKEGLLDEDASGIENIDHFRRQLASEIKRMTEMCETWDKIYKQTILPDSIQESVLCAVGQARLLMSQKMQQFATLVERCARPEPTQGLVTLADLHGFWDMTFMQVENLDMNFKKLEELRARGWSEEAPVPVAKKTRIPVPRTKGPVVVPSRHKEIIAVARKAKKEQVLAPLRTPGPHTPLNKPTLLKAVLSNDAKKSASKISASFAMLHASMLGKMGCEGVAPLPDAIEEVSSMMTRSRRNRLTATEKTCTAQSANIPQRSTRKALVLEPIETNVIAEHTPQRAPRRRRNAPKKM